MLGFAAGLLRPETWPFLGLYALYVFVREPAGRLLAAGLVALLPVLWLGPELWGAGEPCAPPTRAQEPTLFSPAFADRPALAVLDRAPGFVPGPAKLGVLAAAVDGRAEHTRWRLRTAARDGGDARRPGRAAASSRSRRA